MTELIEGQQVYWNFTGGPEGPIWTITKIYVDDRNGLTWHRLDEKFSVQEYELTLVKK